MSGFRLTSRIQLAAGEGYRISGWRGVCSFDGLTASDGSALFGCEVNVEGADRFDDHGEVMADVRFWIPRSYVGELSSGQRIHLFDGRREIGSGVVVTIHDK